GPQNIEKPVGARQRWPAFSIGIDQKTPRILYFGETLFASPDKAFHTCTASSPSRSILPREFVVSTLFTKTIVRAPPRLSVAGVKCAETIFATLIIVLLILISMGCFL